MSRRVLHNYACISAAEFGWAGVICVEAVG